MAIENSNRWAIAGIEGALAILIFSPVAFKGVDLILGGRGYVANEGHPTMLGLVVHAVVFFFLTYALLRIDWQCE
jgi:hypothetical protein